MLQSILSPLGFSRNFSLFIFSQWFLKISICPFLFCGICVCPTISPCFCVPKNFLRKCLPGKLNALKDFWFTFDLFLALLIIVETWVTPTVLLLAGWTWVDWGVVMGVVFVGRFGRRTWGPSLDLRFNWKVTWQNEENKPQAAEGILGEQGFLHPLRQHAFNEYTKPPVSNHVRWTEDEFLWTSHWLLEYWLRKCNWQTSCRQLNNETSLVV